MKRNEPGKTGGKFLVVRQWMNGEVAKLRPLSMRQRLEYVWDYYKLWIIGIVTAVLILTAGIRQFVTSNRENWFYACFANTYADIGNGSTFRSDFARYAGYDLSQKNLVFQAQIYCDPTRKDYGNQYYRVLIASMDSGVLDVLVMEPERLTAIGAAGRLMDLEDERTAAIMQKYADRVITCEPFREDYGKERVAIGIDLTGSVLVGEGCAYPDGAALGVNALSEHPEQAEVFLAYVFGEEPL